jgi:beta-glucosidase
VNALQRAAMAGSRLHIPLLIGHDVIHGYRTIFPIPLGIAATWDPSLAELSASVAAREARNDGVRWTFAPMVDIARDARWGRIAEGAGEDPVLGAAMAAAYVRGFQRNGLLACAKHFAAYGAAQAGRDYSSVDLSERTLREVYLPPFRAAAAAGVASFMSSFNTINGVPSTANRHLLTDILRGEWKFDGFVVTDWDAVAELINHGVAATREEAAVKAITAGVDIDMWDGAFATLAGHVPVATVDAAVRRVLRAKFAAGLFDDPFTPENGVAPTVESRAAARKVAQRSLVLLKNEGAVLPLQRHGKIAIAGPLADSRKDLLGAWDAWGREDETISIEEALRAAAGEARIVSDPKEADVIVAVFGETKEMSGEAASRTSIELPGTQEAELEALAATGKPVVLLVLSGRPLAIAWAAEHVAAIVQCWHPGTEGAHAIADVLFGDVSPSGKLPVTIPRATGQVPIYDAQLPTGRPASVADKFTSKYLDVPIGPLYPFGYGLSYTRFTYSDVTLSAPAMSADGRVTASVVVHNAGDRAGEEVVLLFVRDVVASVSRPVRQLEGFTRIALAPGESKRVEFPIGREQLQFWTPEGWVVEPGEFRVMIGSGEAVLRVR